MKASAREKPILGIELGLPRGPWLEFSVLMFLTGALYYPVLVRLVGQLSRDPNFTHASLVPLFSLYVLWQDRQKIANAQTQPAWSGLPILLSGLLFLVIGTLGVELFTSRASLLITIAGIVILTLGWQMFRIVLFPWAFLGLAIPIPTLILNQVTFPLQMFASRASSWFLDEVLHVPVLRRGNVMELSGMQLQVAEACSGIRSLISLVTLAIIYGYLMTSSVRMRVLLVIVAIPIAIVANSLRIIVTGLLVHYWDPNKAEGFYHGFTGWAVFVVAMLMLFGVHKILERIWPE